MMPEPELCSDKRLTEGGRRRRCVIGVGHDGDQMDADGECWEPPGLTLARLQKTWGAAYWIRWTGTLWLATARDPGAPHRTEIENTPEQLVRAIRLHNAPRPITRARSHP